MKFRTRIVCWNVCSLGSLSDQNAQLRSIFDTMKSRNIDLLILSLSCWPASGATNICDTTILHSGVLSFHTLHVGILLCPWLWLLGMMLGVSFNLCLNVYSESVLNAILPTCLSLLFMLPLILPILLPNLLVSLMLSMTNHNQHFLLTMLLICWS